MFSEFRIKVKKLLKERGITYARLSELTGFEESTIKTRMCGASDSRRIAEEIADLVTQLQSRQYSGKYEAVIDRDLYKLVKQQSESYRTTHVHPSFSDNHS